MHQKQHPPLLRILYTLTSVTGTYTETAHQQFSCFFQPVPNLAFFLSLPTADLHYCQTLEGQLPWHM